MANNSERNILRKLAQRWMELANLPVMEERKRQWAALKDLKAERPMVLVETGGVENYILETELQCEDPYLRMIEKQMKWVIKHAEEVGDDIVVVPVFQIGWDIEISGYGVKIESTRTTDSRGTSSIGYSVQHPIKTPEDIDKLKPRTRKVNREKTMERKALLEDIMGDILPISIGCGPEVHPALTQDLFMLIGMENMMYWVYDEPEALHRLMAFLRDERFVHFKWMEEQGLYGLNNSNQLVASGSPGFTTSLPASGFNGHVRTRDLWGWMESQETVSISPQNFAEIFLPYMAEVSRDFGLIYYGCCEPVHDRWDYIEKAIPNVRAVSISPWCDMNIMGERLGRNCVFSRKPNPSFISSATADWDAMRKDAADTLAAARNCNLEFIFRDLYTLGGDNSRLGKWVEMVRDLMNA